MRWVADQYRGQRVAVDVGIICQHGGGAHRQLGVFGRGVGVVVGCHRRVVDRRDGDGDRGHAALGLAVAGLVGETVCAVEVQRGHVNQRAVGIERECAVSRAVHQQRAQRVAINVGVVGEHPRSADCQLGVFGRGVIVVGRHRRVVDRRNGHGDGS